jgi:hypothetical protein
MSPEGRVRAILYIWLGFAFAAAFSIGASPDDIWLALIYSLTALIATGAVLFVGAQKNEESAKAKRSDTDFYRMLATMDDEELEVLRKRLGIKDENESASIEELINHRESRR